MHAVATRRPIRTHARAYHGLVTLDLTLHTHDEESEVARVARAAPAPGLSAGALAPHLARVVAMQRTAGNAAVARMLAGGHRAAAGAALARDAVATPDAPAPAAAGGGAASPLADLAQRAGSPAGLRAMVAANPALADQIVAHLAADGGCRAQRAHGAGLPAGGVVARSGRPGRAGRRPGAAVAKNPVDPKVPLPAPIPGKKTLAKGDMEWTLKPVHHSSARIDVQFKPDTTKVEAKTISYGQTVTQQVGGKSAYPGTTTRRTHTPIEDPATQEADGSVRAARERSVLRRRVGSGREEVEATRPRPTGRSDPRRRAPSRPRRRWTTRRTCRWRGRARATS